ncbi:hypothetical protein [Alphabaculovirus myunipunctae]|uniref:Ac43-like protein n=1 Tax=Mythimna unipuncta nucleopolyhedrovirus TaxID=447897 RepID=A0A2K9VSE0_9ABAC|nr:hypothetical protein [Mythimna unipuncta nucleopolyhedrovirus]AUV65389.1 hypothetical protein [Mythimna unipuncta nucleopolyhedrovirus]
MNIYANCFLCEQFVYIHKRYSNQASDLFFDRYRSVVKNEIVYCIPCYRDVYVFKVIKLR